MRTIRFIHKWTGLITGLFIFISCLSGAFIEIGKLSGSYSPLFRFMRNLHTSLFLGDTGNLILGICTMLLIVEILSGYHLWIHQTRSILRGAVKNGRGIFSGIKCSLSWKFPNILRGLHTGWGVWAGIPLLIMALTGLTWSFGWYSDIVYSLFDNPADGWDSNLFHTLSALHTGNWCKSFSRLLWLVSAVFGFTLPITGLLLALKIHIKRKL